MSEDRAKTRWMTLLLVRWSGYALFLVGLMIYAGKLPLPREAGYALMAVGLIDALFVPTILARKWKSRP